jgi:tRNA1(Val) A37 N6-methylase TrmN6
MPDPDLAEDVTDDAALGGRLRLLQPRRGHRFGHDAILLAAATSAQSGDHIVELGAGVGAAALALATRVPDVRVTMIELDPVSVRLAQRNIERNRLADRVTAIAADVVEIARGKLESELGDVTGVMMNPPFNEAGASSSPDPRRMSAHVGGTAILASWIAAASRLLDENGSLTLIWRADGLEAVVSALASTFGSVVIIPVCPRTDQRPIRILVRAVVGGAQQRKTLPSLILNGADGRPTAEAEAVLREAQPLAFL